MDTGFRLLLSITPSEPEDKMKNQFFKLESSALAVVRQMFRTGVVRVSLPAVRALLAVGLVLRFVLKLQMFWGGLAVRPLQRIQIRRDGELCRRQPARGEPCFSHLHFKSSKIAFYCLTKNPQLWNLAPCDVTMKTKHPPASGITTLLRFWLHLHLIAHACAPQSFLLQ